MANKSKIEWTDATWNPVRGCTKISPGCKHCYAEAFAERFRGVPGHPYEKGFDLRLVPEKMLEPLQWTKPSTVFVNSMSDLFHPDIPDAFIVQVATVMMAANWHTYQILTKRSKRLREMLNGTLAFATRTQHVWWGVSVEDVRHGVPRIDDLRATPAERKFLSIEPLLENLGLINLLNIDWVIVGGESGRGARPLSEKWVDDILRQCRRAHVPFFFKQWGGVQKKVNGRKLHGRTYNEFPKSTAARMPDMKSRKHLAELLQGRFLKNGSDYQQITLQTAV
ncbi:MAG TPA: phage Gp37/Gp68 family protein [Candidatus Acidoferrum sp.]|jgi:protein gp37